MTTTTSIPAATSSSSNKADSSSNNTTTTTANCPTINNNDNNNNNQNDNMQQSSTSTTATTSSSTESVTTPPTVQRAVTITPILIPGPPGTPNFSRTMQTDEDFNIKFVNLVRDHRCLYDKKVPEYRNRDNQEKAWYQISLETKESVIHCKERWRNLRACLSRYIKQQSGNDPQHKPYYLTEHMAFLLPFLKSTRNSLDGNSSLATLYQYSQQQQQLQQINGLTTGTTLQVMLPQSQLKYNNDQHPLEVKHSLSDNEDEETIDAFDPAITASLHMQQQANRASPPLSDTASANTLQNFIPDVQLSELRTPDGGVQDISYVTNPAIRRDSHHDFLHEPKRIKTECHASEATTTAHMSHMYAGEQADMEFFRSILPDISALTPHQKRKLKIGILELIDDVVDRYPLERSTNANASQNANANSKTRRNSSRDWRK